MSFSEPLSARAAVVLFLAAFLLSVLPIFFAVYPPLHDYPAHIARIFILHHWNEFPVLNEWYMKQSLALPNIGTDLIILCLAKVFSVETAGRLSLAFILGVMLGGCLFLHRVLHGRLTLWPFVSAFFLFNWILLFGFLNYLLGVGVLLWGIGTWVLLAGSPVWLRNAAGTLFATAIFFCHLVAFGLFAVAIAACELFRAATKIRTEKAKVVWDLFAGASIFVVPIVLYFLSPTTGAGRFRIKHADPWLLWKCKALYRSLMSSDVFLDAVLLAVAVLFVGALLAFGKARIARRVAMVPVFLLAAFFALPVAVNDLWYLDFRVPIVILFVALPAIEVTFRNTKVEKAVIVALALLLLVRAAVFAVDWKGYDKTLQEFTAAFEGLPRNAVLFVGNEGSNPDPYDLDLAVWHPPLVCVASLATLNRMVFVPETFAGPSEQPIIVTERYLPLYKFQRHNPKMIRSFEEKKFLVKTIRRLAARTGLTETVFLLVLYPRLPVPEGATLFRSGSCFEILAIDLG